MLKTKPEVIFSLKMKTGKSFDKSVVDRVANFCAENMDAIQDKSKRTSMEDLSKLLLPNR